MPAKKLSYHQRYYKEHKDYQERSKKWAAARFERIKRQGGDELRIMQIHKALFQCRVILNKHMDAVEYQDKRICLLNDELQVLLKRRPNGTSRNPQV
jgi:hypothetical protein